MNRADSPRQVAEKELAQEFMSILQRHYGEITRTSPPPGSPEEDLVPGITLEERKILSRISYQNWPLGFLAGAVTFGMLMGISLRTARAVPRYPLPPRASAGLRELDQTKDVRAKTFPRNKNKRQTRRTEPESSSSLSTTLGNTKEGVDPFSLQSDMMTQVQYMAYGGLAIVVTVITSWHFSDREAFLRRVGRLPLSPGKSRLCQEACPDLVQHYRRLVAQQENDDAITATTTTSSSYLQHPVTTDLDAVLQLVLNCEQRRHFVVDQLATTDRPSPATEDVLVNVPAPGVPFNYLGIPSPRTPSGENDTLTHVADTVVGEYEWLEKLVTDR